MARGRWLTVCGACLLGAAPAAWGVCQFQNDEIVNPFEPGCGDVMLTYTETDNTGNHIALGYPVPIPVDSLNARWAAISVPWSQVIDRRKPGGSSPSRSRSASCSALPSR